MKLAYICGPYRGASIHVVRGNIERAREVAEALWAEGIPVLTPHLNTALMDGVAPDEVFLQGDLLMLGRCDAVILLPGWRESRGATGEMEHACEKGIPCFQWGPGTTSALAFLKGEAS